MILLGQPGINSMSQDINQLIALHIRILAECLLVFFVMPRVWAETKINDDLRILRYIIFYAMIMYIGIGLAIIHMNFCNIVGCTSITITGKVSIIQAFAFLNINIVLWLIYYQKYK